MEPLPPPIAPLVELIDVEIEGQEVKKEALRNEMTKELYDGESDVMKERVERKHKKWYHRVTGANKQDDNEYLSDSDL